MSDGPFKNRKLPRWWKGYMEALANDAVSAEERCAEAAHAVLGDVLANDTKALFSDLQAFADRQQLDFDTVSSAEGIFDSHAKTPFADLLQKEMVYRLAHNEAPDAAFADGMAEAVRGQIEEARTRSQEECIHAADVGEMKQDACDCALERTSADFSKLSVAEICDAAFAGNKKAFRNAIGKQEGLEEGPDL